MDEQPNQKNSQQELSSAKRWLSKPTILIIVIVILALLVAGWLIYKNRQESSDNLPDNTYSFQNTQKVTVRGSSSGKGMAFLKPDEYRDSAAESNNTRAVFVRLETVTEKEFFNTGRMLGRSQDFSKDGPTPESAQTLKQNFNNPSGESYKAATKSVEFTIKNLYSDATVDNIGAAVPFTNQNISKDAWRFDFSTKGKSGAPDQQGTAIVAIGQSGIYYYVVSAKTADWQNNKSFFDNLLSSIQIDL